MEKIRVLIACECSGKVRDAFSHPALDVWSCDILPSARPGKHLQMEVQSALKESWHAVIAFPPCTYLSNAGNAVWGQPGRITKRAEALSMVAQLWDYGCRFTAIENPVGILSRFIGNPSQVIHPYFFGERQMKRTCLWLREFPLLFHSPVSDLFNDSTWTEKPAADKIYSNGKPGYFVSVNSSKGTRQGIRSETFTSVAQAMAKQWTPVLLEAYGIE